jgi:hypothetical protein
MERRQDLERRVERAEQVQRPDLVEPEVVPRRGEPDERSERDDRDDREAKVERARRRYGARPSAVAARGASIVWPRRQDAMPPWRAETPAAQPPMVDDTAHLS